MKLSIVICVYNTQKEYLRACLDSIVNSTVKDLCGGYEICMYDDGSATDYSDVVEQYGVRYEKGENQGILGARTRGVAMARGEYVIFCDSDDTVSFNYYLPMVLKADSSGADIVINDWAFHTDKARYFCKRDDTICRDLNFEGDDILPAFFERGGRQHSYFVLWNKLYRRTLLTGALDSLFEKGYPKSASYAEDAAINFFAWRDALRVVNVHTGYYFYRIHSNQSVNVVSEEKLKSQIESMSICFSVMKDSVCEHKRKDEILAGLRSWQTLMARSHYSYARSARYTSLYRKITEAYNVSELRRSTLKDTSVYSANTLLPNNICEIDKSLLSVWSSNPPRAVSYCRRDRYTARCVEWLKRCGKVGKDDEITVPKAHIPFVLRIIHNEFVYRIGMLLFKKGSRLRAWLKKLL